MNNTPNILDFVKAASDTNRLRIIGVLAQKPATIKEIAHELDLPFRKAFNHISYLEYVGVVHRTGDTFLLDDKAVESLSRTQFSLAVQQMIEDKTGALIVVEREIGLRTFIESGVALDAVVSRDLLCSIFHHGGQLHDGAVIIQGDRIAAAACFLPLHTHPVSVRKIGTRHRAAIGVTEGTDALAVVLSEERGQISIAWREDLEQDVSIDRLRERLIHHATGRPARTDQTPEPEWRRAQP